MCSEIRNDILKLLAERTPNYVNKKVIEKHLCKHAPSDISKTLDELVKEELLECVIDSREEIKSPMQYYRIKYRANLPIRENIKVGEIEVPRILSCSKPQLLPGDFDEAVEQLAQYANSLETRFTELVKKEQRKYWAKIIGVFTIFTGILAVVFQRDIPNTVSITVNPWQDFCHLLAQSAATVVPLALFFVIAAIVLYLLIKK